MRRALLALAAVVGASLCTGCMDTRTAALSIEAQRVPSIDSDAASAPGEHDAGAIVGDAGSLPPEVDPAEGADDDEEHDAGPGSGDVDASESAPDAGRLRPRIDAAVTPASGDAGAADASVVHPDEVRDAAREDARAPVNPLCIAEPWHCQ
jgi:hypothetical protein